MLPSEPKARCTYERTTGGNDGTVTACYTSMVPE